MIDAEQIPGTEGARSVGIAANAVAAAHRVTRGVAFVAGVVLVTGGVLIAGGCPVARLHCVTGIGAGVTQGR